MRARDALFLIIGLALAGCASFAYRVYGLDGVSYKDGILLAPEPDGSKDLPFEACAPDLTEKHKCVVMFAKEFKAFKQDYEDLQLRLKECQDASSH